MTIECRWWWPNTIWYTTYITCIACIHTYIQEGAARAIAWVLESISTPPTIRRTTSPPSVIFCRGHYDGWWRRRGRDHPYERSSSLHHSCRRRERKSRPLADEEEEVGSWGQWCWLQVVKLSTFLPIYPSTYLPFSYLSLYLSIYLTFYQPTIIIYLLFNLPIYLPTHLPTYLPLYHHLPTFLPMFSMHVIGH